MIKVGYGSPIPRIRPDSRFCIRHHLFEINQIITDSRTGRPITSRYSAANSAGAYPCRYLHNTRYICSVTASSFQYPLYCGSPCEPSHIALNGVDHAMILNIPSEKAKNKTVLTPILGTFCAISPALHSSSFGICFAHKSTLPITQTRLVLSLFHIPGCNIRESG